jgi:creatinine amidohydrolase
VERVYFEAAQSLIHHGFRRILLLNGHAGNQYATRFIADRINQETSGTAIDLGEAAAPLQTGNRPPRSGPVTFDRHAGTGETSSGLYLFPNLTDMNKAGKNDVTLPDHLAKMLPLVEAGDPSATRIFLAEALKPKDTGKHTSTREMTATGVWSNRDTKDSSAERGRQETESFVNAAVQFIERWKALEPSGSRR